MARGFAVVKDSHNRVTTSVTQLQPGDQTVTYLSDGSLLSEVKEIHRDASITD